MPETTDHAHYTDTKLMNSVWSVMQTMTNLAQCTSRDTNINNYVRWNDVQTKLKKTVNDFTVAINTLTPASNHAHKVTSRTRMHKTKMQMWQDKNCSHTCAMMNIQCVTFTGT